MKIKTLILNLLILCMFTNTFSQSVVNTLHNLSVNGPGTVKSGNDEVCIFCHTPHNSSPLNPLWNKNIAGSNYILYNSSTTQAAVGQPDGNSILCLSCHDGTIALGSIASQASTISFGPGVTTMPLGSCNLSTDLSDDHPVSFTYNSSLATSDGQLVNPSSLPSAIKLENQKMQCTSCHDPHTNTSNNFLVLTNEYSSICMACHSQNYWTQSSHKLSTSVWNGSGTNPWFHTSYNTVAKNGCENCHDVHSANGKIRLLNYAVEETNCLNCHNGNVAASAKNIQTQITKTYAHKVYNYQQVHDENETILSSTMHVECVDCHNPHAAKNATATAPNVKGYNIGVKGINQSGNDVNPASYEYEICYRCHADSPNKPPSPTTRKIAQNNVRLEFATTNPSFHAVVGTGVNTNVPSLISPYTVSSKMYCSDCHGANGTGVPNGPHGSIYASILKYRYDKADNTTESSSAYQLCYTCHSRTSILNDNSFGEHHKHIVDEKTPCNACHDPHGISSTQGNSTNNTNLINFDLGIVSSLPNGNLYFQDQGVYHGRCYLVCHGETHSTTSYSY